MIHRDQLRADIERAVRAAYPDRAEVLLRELELVGGTWTQVGLERFLDTIRALLGTGRNARLDSIVSTVWSPPQPAGRVPSGTTVDIGRDLANVDAGRPIGWTPCPLIPASSCRWTTS